MLALCHQWLPYSMRSWLCDLALSALIRGGDNGKILQGSTRMD